MHYDAQIYHRQSIRLRGYDYRAAGAYYVTICSRQKREVFGRVVDGEMRRNVYGQLVAECWNEITVRFEQLILDEWIVMPNHLHGILVFHDNRTTEKASSLNTTAKVAHYAPAGSLGSIVGKFKAAATRRINVHRSQCNLSPVVVWQRGFYERIIRDEKELIEIRRYIVENPANWMHSTE